MLGLLFQILIKDLKKERNTEVGKIMPIVMGLKGFQISSGQIKCKKALSWECREISTCKDELWVDHYIPRPVIIDNTWKFSLWCSEEFLKSVTENHSKRPQKLYSYLFPRTWATLWFWFFDTKLRHCRKYSKMIIQLGKEIAIWLSTLF